MIKPRLIDIFKYNGFTFKIEQYGKYTAGILDTDAGPVLVCVYDTFDEVVDYILNNW